MAKFLPNLGQKWQKTDSFQEFYHSSDVNIHTKFVGRFSAWYGPQFIQPEHAFFKPEMLVLAANCQTRQDNHSQSKLMIF